jgi:hypothetical protein
MFLSVDHSGVTLEVSDKETQRIYWEGQRTEATIAAVQ